MVNGFLLKLQWIFCIEKLQFDFKKSNEETVCPQKHGIVHIFLSDYTHLTSVCRDLNMIKIGQQLLDNLNRTSFKLNWKYWDMFILCVLESSDNWSAKCMSKLYWVNTCSEKICRHRQPRYHSVSKPDLFDQPKSTLLVIALTTFSLWCKVD